MKKNYRIEIACPYHVFDSEWMGIEESLRMFFAEHFAGDFSNMDVNVVVIDDQEEDIQDYSG